MILRQLYHLHDTKLCICFTSAKCVFGGNLNVDLVIFSFTLFSCKMFRLNHSLKAARGCFFGALIHVWVWIFYVFIVMLLIYSL